jgi:NAD-dependent SIR2 family protein deacetylase
MAECLMCLNDLNDDNVSEDKKLCKTCQELILRNKIFVYNDEGYQIFIFDYPNTIKSFSVDSLKYKHTDTKVYLSTESYKLLKHVFYNYK